MSTLNEKLARVADRFDEIERLMADPNIVSDFGHLNDLAQERSDIEELVETFRRFQRIEQQIEENKLLVEDDSDPDMQELAEMELEQLQADYERLEAQLKTLLLPKDPNDEKNVIVEVRAGTGGEEAALFAADLFRMYARYSERHRWKVEVLSSSETDNGGFREIIFEVNGRGAYRHLRYESGVHR